MRDTGPISKLIDTSGDVESALGQIGLSRTLLGQLANQMAFAGLKVGARTTRLPDGSAIRVSISHGVRKVEIFAPPVPGAVPAVQPALAPSPESPEYVAASPFAVCVGALAPGYLGGSYNPLPVVINDVQYADDSGRILGAGRVRFGWPTVPDATKAVPNSFMTAVYDLRSSARTAQYPVIGGDILRNGQQFAPINRRVIHSIQDFINVASETQKTGGPWVLYGSLSANGITAHFDPGGAAQFNVLSPPWDSGVQIRIDGGSPAQSLLVDIPPGAEAYCTYGTSGGVIGGTLSVNNLSAPAPTPISTDGFIPFNDDVGYELNITANVQAAPATGGGGEFPTAGFQVQIWVGQPNWPPISHSGLVTFLPGYGAAGTQVNYTFSSSMGGTGSINQYGTQTQFLLVGLIQGGPTLVNPDGSLNPWTGTATGALTGTIAIPDGWGGERTLRVNGTITMTVS